MTAQQRLEARQFVGGEWLSLANLDIVESVTEQLHSSLASEIERVLQHADGPFIIGPVKVEVRDQMDWWDPLSHPGKVVSVGTSVMRLPRLQDKEIAMLDMTPIYLAVTKEMYR